MLYELCLELNNFFEYAVYIGDVVIEDGNVQTDLLQDGQYFRIVGSVFNDGVYQYPQTELKDETYHGGLWAMAVPKEVIALAEEIEEWREKYLSVDSQAMSPYTAESFGGYSYQKEVSSVSNGTTQISWQGVFADRLKGWRKLK